MMRFLGSLLSAGLLPLLLLLAAPSGAAVSKGALLPVEVDKGEVLRLPRPASSVFIANPEVADIQVMSPTLVYVYGRRFGETQLFAVDEKEAILLNRRVVVRHNLSGLVRTLGSFMPDQAIAAESVEAGILLTGQVATAAEAEDARRLATRFLAGGGQSGEVINRIEITGPTQVHLRVRIAEVSRSLAKVFGFNWDAMASFGDYDFALGVGRQIFDPTGAVSRIPGIDSLFASFTNRNVDLNTLIDALSSEGLISLLSEPNLTAMSGETASFLAGGEFPIPVAQETDAISIEFKEFGVQLSFTPTLVGSERINLRVRPEVSQLSAAGSIQINGTNIPALTTRRAETTVELGSGESFAVAGLLSNDVNSDIRRYPVLGDLPIIGPLFRSSSFRRNESELVIIVTPYLVRPVSADRIATPNDGYTPPNDLDLIWHGRLLGERRAEAETPPVGPVGFILE